MEDEILLPNGSSSSPANLRERNLRLAGTPDFGEKFVRVLLQPHHKWVILDSTQLSALLGRLRFSERLAQLQKQLRKYAISFARYIHEHPGETVFALLCIVALTTVPIILPAIGFSSAGPVAGSLAAIWQSSIGFVAAGSPFAFLQSAAMGGAAAGWIYGAGAAGLGVLAGKKAKDWASAWWKKKKEEEEEHGE